MKNLLLKRLYLEAVLLLLPGLFFSAYCQDVPVSPSAQIEQQLENLTENSEDIETEDDAYVQQLQQYSKDPLNLNTATESDLKEIKIFTPLQIQYMLQYRALLGKLIHIYELQAVPGWDLSLIRRIRPYITVEDNIAATTALVSRFGKGENSLLSRISGVLEKFKGYLHDSTSDNFYPGSREKLLLRYKYQFKNLLQYGFTAEKDAGEQFFQGQQKSGFDFYSAHLFARDLGRIKTLAIGDFVVNMGQGLVQWQGLAFKKSADIDNIKRQGEVLRPYNSAGEINFHRGAGLTLKKRRGEATLFVSYRRLDANFVPATMYNVDFVSSLQTSGYHRTKAETADKNVQGQLTVGGNLSYSIKKLHLGLNGVHYNFKYPIYKNPDLYNSFALSGASWGNYSLDYSYTFKNLHIFGEAATDIHLHKALVTGLLINTDARVDMSFLYRKISRAYQSLYTNAFTESTYPNNESGFYVGTSIQPTDSWKIEAYADLYYFPWLKFRVNAPASGKEYLVQATYKPNKQIEVYTRYRSENKSINDNPGELVLTPAVNKPRQSWRTQFICKISSSVTFRSRVEILWYDKKSISPESGFLVNSDILYKPLMKRYSGNIRLQYFETDSYNSRLYAFENDVLYSFSIPVFYDRGYRYYVNLNYDLSKRLSFWLRVSQTVYSGKQSSGSALDEISAPHKTEIKLQSLFTF